MTLFLITLAFFIGAAIGAFAMALCVCAANADRAAARHFDRYPKETT